MKVIKFGGSNLKKREDISKLVKVIQHYKRPVIVVISALYGITDSIISTIETVHKDYTVIEQLQANLLRVHREILSDYITQPEQRRKTFEELEKRIEEMNRFLLGIHYIGEAPDFVRDRVLSYGERLSAFTLEKILNTLKIQSIEALPEEIGLLTDGEFGNATVDFEKCTSTVASFFKDDLVYIVPGFYGISESGKVNLFGRSGSDYSAAALARCVNAQSLDLWKDVKGFLSADPKIVPNAWNIKRMSYLEAAELSYFGAEIIHPRAFEPLKEDNIPLNLFNINGDLKILRPLTVITSKSVKTSYMVKSCSYTDDIGILKLKGPGVGVKPGILADVTTSMKLEGINIKSVLTSQTIISVLLSWDDLYKAYKLLQKIKIPGIAEIEIQDEISLIAIVGEGINDTHGIAAKLFNAISGEGINAKVVSMGVSDVASYFIVDSVQRNAAIKSIHKEFFDEKHR